MSILVLKGSTSGQVTLQPAAEISPNVTFTLPSVDGTSGQVLATNGSGTLSFITNDGTASFAAANAASSYANGAFISANTPSHVANSASSYANGAFAKANTLFDGTASANVDSLIVNDGYVTTNNNNNLILTPSDGNVFIQLPETSTEDSNALLIAHENSNGAIQIKAHTNIWYFSADGSLTIPGNISGANTITADTITSVNVISSNTVSANNIVVSGTLNVDGVNVLWHTPPLTSKGSAGDVAGLIAIDNDKLYRCIADYTDGNSDIWVFVNFTGGTWG